MKVIELQLKSEHQIKFTNTLLKSIYQYSNVKQSNH